MGGSKETGIRISNFINAKKRVLDLFGIADDFYIKPLIGKSWEITVDEMDFYLLKHGDLNSAMQSAVIVKKDNKPLVVKRNGYTMVIALDCVKVCFIFDNSKYVGKMPDF